MLKSHYYAGRMTYKYMVPLFLIFFLLLFCSNSLSYVGGHHRIPPIFEPEQFYYSKNLPDISHNPQSKLFLVVWNRPNIDTGLIEISGQIFDENWQEKSQVLSIYYSGINDYRKPEVTCSNNGDWLVLAGTDGGLYAKIIKPDGSMEASVKLAWGSDSILKFLYHYDVSGSTDTNEYLVVWHESFGPDDEINAIIYSPESGVRDTFKISESNGVQKPSVNQRGDNFYVAWERKYSETKTDIEGRYVPLSASSRFDLGGVTKLWDQTSTSTLAGDVSVTADTKGGGPNKFIAAWWVNHDDGNFDIYYSRISENSVVYKQALTLTSELEYKPTATFSGISGRYYLCYPKANDWESDWNIYCNTIDWADNVGATELIAGSTTKSEGSPKGTTIGGSYGKVSVVYDFYPWKRYIDIRDIYISKPVSILQLISGVIKTNSSPVLCSRTDLEGCKNEASCEKVGGYWYEGTCNASPQSLLFDTFEGSSYGTINGATFTNNGHSGQGLLFEEVGDSVRYDSSFFPSQGTFEAYIYLTGDNPNWDDIIFDSNARGGYIGKTNIALRINSDRNLYFYFWGPTTDSTDKHKIASSNALELNTWYSVGASWGSEGIYLYIDGQLQDSDPSATDSWNPEPVYLGNCPDDDGYGSNYYNSLFGIIDSVRTSTKQNDITY